MIVRKCFELLILLVLVVGLVADLLADESLFVGSEDNEPSALNRPLLAGETYQVTVPATLDLAERARLGLNHFTRSISEAHNYEMYWGVQPLGLSPEMMDLIGLPGESKWGCAFGEYNNPFMVMWWSPLHACQPKALEVMAMERLMSGDAMYLGREARMLRELASYVHDDGLYYVPDDPSKTWLGPSENRPHANMHGQGRMMRAMIIWYQFTGNPVWKELVDRMVDGLDRIAVHKQDYAYFPVHGWIDVEYFRSSYTRQGWKDTIEPTHEKFGEEGSLFNHQGHIPGALANWFLLTGNQKALDLSGELVRFYTKPQFWADWEKGEYPGIVGAEHAHWRGHLHGHVNVLRAILEYAIATNDTRLMNFVRDGYEWARQMEIARIGLVGDGQGCGCWRLIGLAVKLSYAGVGDYWEDVDLYIRNHGVEMQFTPEDARFLHALGQGKPEAPEFPGATSKDVVETTIGGYSNHVPPYKTSTSLCCSPHGNMGLFYAWDATLRYEDSVARINLLLNRASPWLDIDSYLPFEGKVVLRNKQATEAFVRIPLWVDGDKISCTVRGEPVSWNWFGRYLHLRSIAPGDAIVLQFPVEERTETWTKPDHQSYLITAIPGGTKFDLRFRGNTVVEVTPPLMKDSPLYRNRLQQFSGEVAPMRTVTRQVTPLVLKW